MLPQDPSLIYYSRRLRKFISIAIFAFNSLLIASEILMSRVLGWGSSGLYCPLEFHTLIVILLRSNVCECTKEMCHIARSYIIRHVENSH